MSVELNRNIFTQKFTRSFYSFINRLRSGRAAGILEAETVKRNSGIEEALQAVGIEFRSVNISFLERGSKTHHGNADLMLDSGILDALAGEGNVAYVIQRIKVTDGGYAVLGEHFGMQVNDVAGLGYQTNHVSSTGEGLKIYIRTNHRTDFIHNFKSILLAVKIAALEESTAANFKIGGAGLQRGFNRGSIVFKFYARSETGLKTVAERSIHVRDFFSHLPNPLLFMLSFDVNFTSCWRASPLLPPLPPPDQPRRYVSAE